jgi:hypothetical protein
MFREEGEIQIRFAYAPPNLRFGKYKYKYGSLSLPRTSGSENTNSPLPKPPEWGAGSDPLGCKRNVSRFYFPPYEFPLPLNLPPKPQRLCLF